MSQAGRQFETFSQHSRFRLSLIHISSCDGFKGGSKDLKAENDSLLMELNQRNTELDDMMGTFNEVQEGFRKINAAESRVDLQRRCV